MAAAAALEVAGMKLKGVSLNARGLQSTGVFNKLVACADTWRVKEKLSVLCVQEHNLDPKRESELIRLAEARGFGIEIGFAQAGQDGTHWGGTFILWDKRVLTLKATQEKSGDLTRVSLEWNGATWNVASVYAPVGPQERVAFFTNLASRLSKTTIIGGDWNCVPDVTLDVSGPNSLNYSNVGAALIDAELAKVELYDVRRDQLGTDKEPTRIGGTCATRLDRWYVPLAESFEEILWTIDVRSDLVFKSSELDHLAVVLTLETPDGDAGHERQLIREDLLKEIAVQDKVVSLTEEAYKKGGSESTKWDRAHCALRSYLLNLTAARRARERVAIRQTRALLSSADAMIRRKGPSDALRKHRAALQQRLFKLQNPESTPVHEEAQARRCADRSDKCTRATFSSYKAIAKQQWINRTKKADWQEGVDPVFDGHTSTPKEVSGELMKYYKMLFAKKSINKDEERRILRVLEKRKLFAPARDALEKPITKDEILRVMENLPLGKQAGPDRIPNAVYKYLPTVFAPKLAALLDESLQRGALPKTFLQGDIGLLYKKKDREDVRNYRPITLLQNAYKIYTRVLTHRMRDVVHQFVSESQKGFVPKAFIAECTMLLNLIEAHVNDDPENREGLFIFLDMEKAFDRCSWEYILDALNAVGFGPNFIKSVRLMYDTDRPPERRIYANGYYSDWFPIQSGVAQGCPLSPLLFLLVAEGLRATLDLEPRVQGIKIGRQRFKLSQFADDTTLILRGLAELNPALDAVRRWGLATAMRENMTKREGLALGKLRQRHLGRGIAWVKDEKDCGPNDCPWAISLGVPIGNELNSEKFWKKRLDAVRDKAKRWGGLYRASISGRNLIVQSMYYGSLRYWLYSLPMSKAISERISTEANILLWSKEADLTQPTKRFRRFVAEATSIGPRGKGGLNLLDWPSHVAAFQAQWMIRYAAHPSDAAWKRALDEMLLINKKGLQKFPEKRAILLCDMTPTAKLRMLRGFPKKAKYLRDCLFSFWKLRVKQDLQNPKDLAAEPFWHNTRFKLNAPQTSITYFSGTTEVEQLGDVIDSHTGRPFDRQAWEFWVKDRHMEHKKSVLRAPRVRQLASEMLAITQRVPAPILAAAAPPAPHTPQTHETVALVSDDGEGDLRYGKRNPPSANKKYAVYWADAMGSLHDTGEETDGDDDTAHEVVWWTHSQWDRRACGPKAQVFPHPNGWLLEDQPTTLNSLSIQKMTRALTMRRFKEPACKQAWEERLGAAGAPATLPWPKIFKMKSFFATPRDQIAGLKLQHRNLYLPDTCLACGEVLTEAKQLHYCKCPILRIEFWDEVVKWMTDMGMPAPDDLTTFIATGAISAEKAVSANFSGIWFIAHRTCYAANMSAYLDNHALDLEKALKRALAMILGRLKAYGARWEEWVVTSRYREKPNMIPSRHRNKKVIQQKAGGDYEIAQTLIDEAKRLGLI